LKLEATSKADGFESLDETELFESIHLVTKEASDEL